MNKARRLLPLLGLALVLTGTGCAVPLPAPELTATAQSQLPPPTPQPVIRAGSDVGSASSGAPSNTRLEQAVGGEDAPSALAPLEDEELAGAEPVEAPTEPTPEVEVDDEPDATSVPEATPQPTADASQFVSQVVELLNKYREKQGIGALQTDAALSSAAMAHAQYMGSNGFFGHYPPSGSTPAGRIADAGFAGQYQGEALSAGQGTPAVALSRLLGSSAHAAILLNPSSVAVGVGYFYQPGSRYGHYWVIVTGNP